MRHLLRFAVLATLFAALPAASGPDGAGPAGRRSASAGGGEDGGRPPQRRQVVVYVSHDQEHSESILKLFEERTGIRVRADFDTEDTKTVGLTQKLISERAAPVADVFWNNECGQTERLKALGLLQIYRPPNAAAIPAIYKDADGTWTGFAARARVLMWNRDLVPDESGVPRRLEDLAKPEFRSKVAMCRPRTGTTLTHAGALFAAWGESRTMDWFRGMIDNDVRWESGNAQVAQAVADGAVPFGLTDTDDVRVRVLAGARAGMVYLDQEEDGLGTLVIPNSVMIMSGAPNLEEAKELVDFLVSKEVEELLAAGRAAQMPLHPDAAAPPHVTPAGSIRAMPVDFAEVGRMIDRHLQDLETLFSGVQGGRKVEGGRSTLALVLALFALLLGGLFTYQAIRRGGRHRRG